MNRYTHTILNEAEVTPGSVTPLNSACNGCHFPSNATCQIKNAFKRRDVAFLTQSDHQIQAKGASSLNVSLVIAARYVI